MSGRLPGANPQGASGGYNVFNISNSSTGIQLGSSNVRTVNGPSSGTRSRDKTKKPKKPLSQSRQEPTMLQLDHICQKIDKCKETAWKELGERLGLSQGEVETVEHDFRFSGIPEACHQMLRKWKERQPTPPQVKVLAQALCDIGRGDLSDYLA